MKNLTEVLDTSSLSKDILKGIAVGTILLTAVAVPGVGYVVKEFEKEKNNKKKLARIKFVIKRLEKRNFVSWREKDGVSTLTLTEKGKKRVLQYDLDEMKLKKTPEWDGYYRVVIFDIPEHKKTARDSLRKKLKEMEFFQLQKSVFVTPYECKGEVDFLGQMYGIGPYITFIKARYIDGIDITKWF